MKEIMLKTVAVCVAASSFGLGTYVIGSGAKSIASDSVVTLVSDMEARRLAVEKSLRDAEEGSETIVQSLRKFGGLRLPK